MPNPGQHYPDHLRGFVVSAADLFPSYEDNYHYHYQVVCRCGSRLFRVYVSDKESVKAHCAACNTEIMLYDLSKYPAATKLEGPEEFQRLTTKDQRDATKVFVMYEYSRLRENMEYDPNDITWFYLWLEDKQGVLEMMIDDETA